MPSGYPPADVEKAGNSSQAKGRGGYGPERSHASAGGKLMAYLPRTVTGCDQRGKLFPLICDHIQKPPFLVPQPLYGDWLHSHELMTVFICTVSSVVSLLYLLYLTVIRAFDFMPLDVSYFET